MESKLKIEKKEISLLAEKMCKHLIEDYIDKLSEAFLKKDWKELDEISLMYESDCYRLGEVEIAGKIILMRLHLYIEKVDVLIIKMLLNKIFELSVKYQRFLLETHKYKDFADKEELHFIKKTKCSLEYLWEYSICSLQ